MNTPNSGGETGESPVFRPVRQVTVFWQGKRLTMRTLRPTPSDAQQLSALTRQVALEGWLGSADPLGDGDRTLQFIRASLRNGSLLIGLFDGHLLVGHLGLDRWLEPEGGTDAGLVLYLASPYRGAGLGKALLQMGLAAARHLGISQVHAASHPQNQVAAALYQSAGFHQQTAAIPFPDLGSADAPVESAPAADTPTSLPQPTVYWVMRLKE